MRFFDFEMFFYALLRAHAGILDGNAVQVESALDDVGLIEPAAQGWVRTGGAKKHYVDEWGVGFEAS